MRVISLIEVIEFFKKIIIKPKNVAQEKFWVLVCSNITKKEAPRICGENVLDSLQKTIHENTMKYQLVHMFISVSI